MTTPESNRIEMLIVKCRQMPDDRDKLDAYMRFKQALRLEFPLMQPDDYTEAIHRYCDHWMI